MNTYRLRVLHVSDIHAKCPTTSAQNLNDIDAISFARAIDSFIAILSETQADYPVDVVCITGDIAHSGQKEQYLVAQSLFARIAQALFKNIEFTTASQNFFIVPGNHDIERNKEQALWKKARTVLQGNDRTVSQWLHKRWRPTGTRKDLHDILKRSESYTSWIKECYPHISKDFGTRGPIGYYYKLVTNKFPFPIHISGLDSSWLCGDDKDHLNIVLTTEQIDQLSYTQNAKHEDGFRLALLHHPLTWLRDHNECKTLLAKSSDLLLCVEVSPSVWTEKGLV